MSKYFIKVLFITFLLLGLSQGNACFSIEDKTDDIKLTQKQEKNLIKKIDFEDILKKAEEHSYDLKIADYNVLISKQGVRAARSEYFPKLNVGAGTEYTKNYRDANESTVMSIGEAFINPYTRYQTVLGITAGYNLFDFGVRGKNLKLAKEDVLLKELENKEKLQELNLTILDTYAKILLMSKQIEINKEILKTEEKNLEYYERLFKAKEISKTELNDSKVRVNAVKNRISELNSIKADAVNWLSFYTGEEYDSVNLEASKIKTGDFDILSGNDYSKSLVWKIHEKNIQKKETELQIAKRNNYPKLNVYGKYYLYGSDRNRYAKSFENIEPSNFSVGASLNMPVFDGFKNSANIQKTSLELKQTLIERDKAIATLMTRLASMRSNIEYLDRQILENDDNIKELSDKEKSMGRLASKKIISPIEYNNSKIELLNQKIELEKNTITKTAMTKAIQILTEEI